jgi:hypothetical protein
VVADDFLDSEDDAMQHDSFKTVKCLTITALLFCALGVTNAQAFYRYGRYGSSRSYQNTPRVTPQMLQAQAKQMQQMQKNYLEMEKKAQEAEVKRQAQLKLEVARRHERLAEEKQARSEKNKKHNAEMAAKGMVKPAGSDKKHTEKTAEQKTAEEGSDSAKVDENLVKGPADLAGAKPKSTANLGATEKGTTEK